MRVVKRRFFIFRIYKDVILLMQASFLAFWTRERKFACKFRLAKPFGNYELATAYALERQTIA